MKQKTKKNIYFTLLSREYNITNNITRNVSVVKRMVCKKDAEFSPIFFKSSKNKIFYEREKLYFNNYQESVLIYGSKGLPKTLFKLDRSQAASRFKDCLIAQCPLSTIPLKNHGYKGSLIMVNNNNVLRRYDLDTGKYLEQFILPRKYHFSYLAWNVENYSFSVKTVKTWGPNVQEERSGSIMAFSVFDVFPLTYVGTFEIRKKIFGGNVQNVNLHLGLLVVMCSHNIVKLYSFEQILQEAEVCNVEKQLASDREVPINIKINKRPAILLQMKTEDHDLAIGGFPWHVLYVNGKFFQVACIAKQLLAKNGKIKMSEASNVEFENDRCFFHPDESGRVCLKSAHHLRVFKLKELIADDHLLLPSYELYEQFSIDFTTDNALSITDAYSSSGRLIKRKVNSYCHNRDQLFIYSMDYEDDLNLLVVTVCEFTSEDEHSITVRLYDNSTGELVKKIPLLGVFKEHFTHNVILDLDTLIHIIDTGMNKHTVIIYQLHRNKEDKELWRRSKEIANTMDNLSICQHRLLRHHFMP